VLATITSSVHFYFLPVAGGQEHFRALKSKTHCASRHAGRDQGEERKEGNSTKGVHRLR
jgi:hypothetical protein